MKNRDPLLCLAQQLCRVLGMGAGLSNRLDPKISALLLASQDLDGCQRRVETARRHGWMLAAAKVQEDLLYPLRRMATLAQQALQSRHGFLMSWRCCQWPVPLGNRWLDNHLHLHAGFADRGSSKAPRNNNLSNFVMPQRTIRR